MSLFSKMFGPKAAADNNAAQPPAGDLAAAFSMHLRGELEPALAAYLKIAEEVPDANLAPFFAAAIMAGKGNIVEAVESLRLLSRRIASEGDNISRVIALELAARGDDLIYINIAALADLVVSFGDLLKKEGFLRECAVCFEIAGGLSQDNANVLHKLGDPLHDLRMYDYAESVLLEAIKHAPYHWGALYTYAVLLQDLGRDEEAISYYQQAVRLNPDHARCQNNYGAALLRTNRLEEALAHCTVAARLDPGSPLVKINLGNIHLLLKEYEKARTCFDEAISLNNNLSPAYYGLASAEQALEGDPKRIRELYLKAIEANPSFPQAHHALGNLLTLEGDPEALSHFAAAAQLNHTLKDLHRDFGSACLHLGRREEGVEHLRIALEQNPDDATVRDLLARVEEETQG